MFELVLFYIRYKSCQSFRNFGFYNCFQSKHFHNIRHVVINFMITNRIFAKCESDIFPWNQKINSKDNVSNHLFCYTNLIFLLFLGPWSRCEMNIFPNRSAMVTCIFTKTEQELNRTKLTKARTELQLTRTRLELHTSLPETYSKLSFI